MLRLIKEVFINLISSIQSWIAYFSFMYSSDICNGGYNTLYDPSDKILFQIKQKK